MQKARALKALFQFVIITESALHWNVMDTYTYTTYVTAVVTKAT